ncbi:MAG TPA: class I SAM-dependent methyltransferase [Nannocystis exedens]|nr:class I SAM-dependent methyltransferase [Nannocystis exedens]
MQPVPSQANVPDLARELVCPECLQGLSLSGQELRCTTCDRLAARRHHGILDFIGERVDLGHSRGLGPQMMHSRLLARVYQRYWRPAFIAFAGGEFHDLEEEFGFIDRALRPRSDGLGGTVVDLSCGPGHAALHLHARGLFSRVIGLDWSQPMLQQLGDELRSREIHDLPLVRADVARLPFASGSIDALHAGAALHLWPDPAAAAAEIGRVLRPGAGFIASTFAHQKNPISRSLEALVGLAHARVFYQEELLGLFHAHGIDDLQVYRRGSLILFWGRRR